VHYVRLQSTERQTEWRPSDRQDEYTAVKTIKTLNSNDVGSFCMHLTHF